MARPKKHRKIYYVPNIKIYGPLDGSGCEEVIVMTYEELESLRLMDLEGLDQNECADKMLVARSTFQRIYTEAKRKIADSIVNAKVLKIEGGNFIINKCTAKCLKCGEVWEAATGNLVSNEKCPKCGSHEFSCIHKSENGICKGCGRGRC
ncbi:hypothetical protein ABG79_00963 [Caloramator mitchellensis]|uniref:UPF0251 protein ABG79_00963 n=1 Tax=Caloramator mitchellensis TaxID=908809 RepID=A0A0R3JXV8_CALMK|nr:DUF134 domain-containing protein [Caloramator mitchellensis]KRQ87165.1 hypothetical protein ABG79_00963 [Caloramator mitchellensis]